MSKVINFNAREFKFDDTCNDNVGTRMFVTDDALGENVEVFEIGDWMWAWTQICCEKKLDKNTDYVFRFAMTGGYNDTCDGVSQFIICPIKEGGDVYSSWADRYTYSMLKSEYKPTLSKRCGNGMLRIYEIPFSTGDCEVFRFVFVAQHAVARFMPAGELSVYAELPDYSYGDWYNERFGGKNRGGNGFGGDFSRNISEFVNRTIANAIPRFGNYNTSGDGDGMDIERTNANMSGRDLAGILSEMGDGCHLNFSNCNISDVDGLLGCGCSSDGSSFEMTNTNIGGRAFCGVLQKIGDGCDVHFINTTVSSVEQGYADSGCSSDGCNIELRSATMASSVFSALISKLGDGCVVEMNNAFIKADGVDIDGGCSSDGCVINLSNTKLPKSIYLKLKAKMGDGCAINETNVEIYPDDEIPMDTVIENELLRKTADLMAVSGPSNAEYVAQKLGISSEQAKTALTGLCDRGLVRYLNGANEYLATISPEDMANFTFQE